MDFPKKTTKNSTNSPNGDKKPSFSAYQKICKTTQLKYEADIQTNKSKQWQKMAETSTQINK